MGVLGVHTITGTRIRPEKKKKPKLSMKPKLETKT
jgi:hypothetical protein